MRDFPAAQPVGGRHLRTPKTVSVDRGPIRRLKRDDYAILEKLPEYPAFISVIELSRLSQVKASTVKSKLQYGAIAHLYPVCDLSDGAWCLITREAL